MTILADTARNAPAPIRFLATSGHELGFLGLKAGLDARPAPANATWLHLGANLGARGGVIRCWSSDPQLRALAADAFAAVGLPSPEVLPGPVGEAIELHSRGRACLSLVGTSSRFHRVTDRFPDNVDLDSLVGVARAARQIVERLSDTPDRSRRSGAW